MLKKLFMMTVFAFLFLSVKTFLGANDMEFRKKMEKLCLIIDHGMEDTPEYVKERERWYQQITTIGKTELPRLIEIVNQYKNIKLPPWTDKNPIPEEYKKYRFGVCAIQAIGLGSTPQGYDFLTMIVGDKTLFPEYRSIAIQMVGESKNKKYIKPLMRVFEEKCFAAKEERNAFEAAISKECRNGKQKCTEQERRAIVKLSKCGDLDFMRKYVCLSLSQIGDKSVIPVLKKVAKDDYERIVRQAACEAIGELGDKGDIAFLEGIADTDENEQVKKSARKAIEKIQGEK